MALLYDFILHTKICVNHRFGSNLFCWLHFYVRMHDKNCGKGKIGMRDFYGHHYLFFHYFSSSSFRQLQCDRVTLHKNLFISYILNGFVWIFYYTLAALSGDVLMSNPVSTLLTNAVVVWPPPACIRSLPRFWHW